jgi:hypothetical protein
MQNYAVARGSVKGPRREGPYDEGFVSYAFPSVKGLTDVVAAALTSPCPEIN